MAPDTESRTPWLALSFGCCASRRDSIDDNGATLRANGETEMQICYDQPQAVAQPRAEPIHTRPTTSHSMRHVSQWVSSGREFATRASSRASIHTIHKPRNSRAKARPSIGRPTDFRHCDGLDGFDGVQSMLDDAPMPVRRRRSFRPLELSIYLPDGRLSPLPDFTMVEWEKLPAELELPAQALVRDRDSRTSSVSSNRSSSYLIQRKPVGSGSRRSSMQSQNSLQSRPGSLSLPFLLEEPTTRPESVLSNPNTLQRSNTQSTFASTRRIVSRLPSPSRSRSNTETSQRGSLRRAKTDVDEAIRELNTIVEERRASAYRSNNLSPALINRPPPSPSHHVPLIAPSLRMHVRSETLSDIGSAFSVPLASKPLPTPPTPKPLSRTNTRLTLSPPSRISTGGPLSSNPITPPTPTIPTPTTPIHRLGAWLKRSMPTTPTSPSLFKAYSSSSTSKPQTPTTQPAATSTSFYQCTPPLPPSSHSNSYSMKLASRPSTAGSRTVVHTRQDSNDTATVTLFSTNSDHQSYPSTPALSTRSLSPEPLTSPLTPARNTLTQNPNILKGTGKPRRVPAPLTLAKEKEMMLEAPLASARSFASTRSANGAQLKPPMSPNYGLLAGMEMSAKAGMRGSALTMEGSPVGVAF